MRTARAAAELTHVIGTDAYLAPEQADPRALGTPGHASDVWGLGATLFHAIAGERPFAEGEPGTPGRSATGSRRCRGRAAPAPDRSPGRWRRWSGAALERDPRTARPARDRRRACSRCWSGSRGPGSAGFKVSR